jgi:hypothetical protein
VVASDVGKMFAQTKVCATAIERGLVEARDRVSQSYRRFAMSVQRLGWLAVAGDAPAVQPTM